MAPSLFGVKNPGPTARRRPVRWSRRGSPGFFLLPALAPLTILGELYDLYLLHLGLPKLMRDAEGHQATRRLSPRSFFSIAITRNPLLSGILFLTTQDR